ncbi:class I SAM-dependent methyltransferase [Nocardia aurantia]|uniref:S-adenosyl-L-methionine-dependent methyltransferase n=1 Tax=Nocardia aurantia TaxID=2585199 RepID=A0A7K0DYW1_9NOCA|nr:class I SAM-dependent methyltransferase [Nocardia aurantia]MQY30905.1 putative S-adenosyl-L-methionine-dependent methyltransferase [Nocardia aurantia]
MRTDGDSWEITESVGATALGVAAMRAAETRRDDALFHDPYAERLVRATGDSGWARMLDGDFARRRAELGRAGVGNGGFLVGRTVYFDEYFAAATAAGLRQVVILAAGLDARAFRLEWPSGTVLFELDQPKVLAFKAGALTGVAPAADRREVAVDLRQDWPKILRDNGFNPSAPTAWLAEGLLRYLPADALDRLFDNIDGLSATGSRIALNSGQVRSRRSEYERVARAKLLADIGIQLDLDGLWYDEAGRSDPAEWFGGRGWTVSSTSLAEVLSAHGRPTSADESADIDRHTLLTAIRG